VRRRAQRGTLYFTEPLVGVLAEGTEALAAELQQRVALAIAQVVAAHQGVGALHAAGDAVEGEPGPPCAFQDPVGDVLRRASSSMSISGWSMGLMRMRLAMVSSRRRKAAEGGGGIGASWLGCDGGGTCREKPCCRVLDPSIASSALERAYAEFSAVRRGDDIHV